MLSFNTCPGFIRASLRSGSSLVAQGPTPLVPQGKTTKIAGNIYVIPDHEARVLAQGVEPRAHFEIGQLWVALLVSLFQPREASVLLAQGSPRGTATPRGGIWMKRY